MSFYFVQRLEASSSNSLENPFVHPNLKHVSKVFQNAGAQVGLAHMGAAEFETLDAAPASAGRILEVASMLRVVRQQLVRPASQPEAYFVCTADQEADLLPQWHKWAENPNTRLPTGYFKDMPEDQAGLGLDRIIGWWGLQEDLIWTDTPEVAESIRGAFTTIASQQAGQLG